ncbi:MAG TPA: transcription elongation factor GreA [Gammaproteobacteria bacterium]|jgi:transcription elongation factor GreA|nr:transcription elongation factor GreA [Gammaproteobacteria bacterium]
MHPMTSEGETLLKEELRRLKFEERPSVIDAIATAREFGDLKENAEYHAAKEQQALIEARIKNIESKLSDSQVIDVTQITPSDKVIFGTTVLIKDLADSSSLTYKIVGEDEANIKEGKISVVSPVAKKLIGKFEGDEVRVETPGGIKEYEIIKVKYI